MEELIMAHEEEFIPKRRERLSKITSEMDDMTPVLPSQILENSSKEKKVDELIIKHAENTCDTVHQWIDGSRFDG